ncbi:MAG TPA: tetratricopeptide repeat protein, partial [Chlamydiales bacterium]|nr:tetratricopeptide repeat protein [Chlamydiales bacterium]
MASSTSTIHVNASQIIQTSCPSLSQQAKTLIDQQSQMTIKEIENISDKLFSAAKIELNLKESRRILSILTNVNHETIKNEATKYLIQYLGFSFFKKIEVEELFELEETLRNTILERLVFDSADHLNACFCAYQGILAHFLLLSYVDPQIHGEVVENVSQNVDSFIRQCKQIAPCPLQPVICMLRLTYNKLMKPNNQSIKNGLLGLDLSSDHLGFDIQQILEEYNEVDESDCDELNSDDEPSLYDPKAEYNMCMMLAGSTTDVSKKLFLIEEAADCAAADDDTILACQARMTGGQIAFRAGYFEEAFNFFQAAFCSLTEETADLIPEADQIGLYSGLVATLCSLGKKEMAQSFIEDFQKQEDTIKDASLLVGPYQIFATFYCQTYQWEKSLKYAQLAMEIAEKIKNIEVTASCYQLMGLVYATQGDGKQAYDLNKCALEAAKMLDDPVNVFSCYHRLGNACLLLENYKESLNWYLLALEGFKKLNNFAELCTIYSSMSGIYTLLDQKA